MIKYTTAYFFIDSFLLKINIDLFKIIYIRLTKETIVKIKEGKKLLYEVVITPKLGLE